MDAQLEIGDVVHTAEGLPGTVHGVRWDADNEEWYYRVRWDDGVVDEQPESFFVDDLL